MRISRVATLSLALAVTVFALGYMNPSFAAPKKCKDAPPDTPGCGGGSEPSGSTHTVDLRGAPAATRMAVSRAEARPPPR